MNRGRDGKYYREPLKSGLQLTSKTATDIRLKFFVRQLDTEFQTARDAWQKARLPKTVLTLLSRSRKY